jgi:hypothetical protein
MRFLKKLLVIALVFMQAGQAQGMFSRLQKLVPLLRRTFKAKNSRFSKFMSQENLTILGTFAGSAYLGVLGELAFDCYKEVRKDRLRASIDEQIAYFEDSRNMRSDSDRIAFQQSLAFLGQLKKKLLEAQQKAGVPEGAISWHPFYDEWPGFEGAYHPATKKIYIYKSLKASQYYRDRALSPYESWTMWHEIAHHLYHQEHWVLGWSPLRKHQQADELFAETVAVEMLRKEGNSAALKEMQKHYYFKRLIHSGVQDLYPSADQMLPVIEKALVGVRAEKQRIEEERARAVSWGAWFTSLFWWRFYKKGVWRKFCRNSTAACFSACRR